MPARRFIRRILHSQFRGAAKAVFEEATPPPLKQQFSARVYAAATAYLAETLDWLNLWEDNSNDFAEECEAVPQEHLYPHL